MQYRPIEFYYWAVPLAALVAVALLYGLKHLILGRFVGDLPRVCRRCKYDLTGLTEPSPCPECGRDLSERRAVRCGRRVRSPRRVLEGVIIAAGLTVVGVLLELLLSHTPQRELRFVSDMRLVRAARADSPLARQQASGSVLVRRLSEGSLSDRAIQGVIEAILNDASIGTHSSSRAPVLLHERRAFVQAGIERGVTTQPDLRRIAEAFLGFDVWIAPSAVTGFDAQPIRARWEFISHFWLERGSPPPFMPRLQIFDARGNEYTPLQSGESLYRGWTDFARIKHDPTVTIRVSIDLQHPLTGEPLGMAWESEHRFEYDTLHQTVFRFRPSHPIEVFKHPR